MTLILASFLKTYDLKDKTRKAIKLDDNNKMLSNIKKYTNKFDSFAYIANDPNDFSENDKKFINICQSFEMSGLNFKEQLLIDGRTKDFSKIASSDLIILGGGKCLCQLKFWQETKIDAILKNFKNLIIGISAGAMNLCEIVANYVEEPCDLAEPRWMNGLDLCDKVIIPHFDGKNVCYELPYYEIKVVQDYILPMSFKEEFLALDNNSYILINNDKLQIFGNAYKIFKGKVEPYKQKTL